jgi:hypothetical protein
MPSPTASYKGRLRTHNGARAVTFNKKRDRLAIDVRNRRATEAIELQKTR